MTKVYLVIADWADYDDRITRVVAAYSNVESAKEHVLRATEEHAAIKRQALRDGKGDAEYGLARGRTKGETWTINRYDYNPDCNRFRIDTTYSVEELDVNSIIMPQFVG